MVPGSADLRAAASSREGAGSRPRRAPPVPDRAGGVLTRRDPPSSHILGRTHQPWRGIWTAQSPIRGSPSPRAMNGDSEPLPETASPTSGGRPSEWRQNHPRSRRQSLRRITPRTVLDPRPRSSAVHCRTYDPCMQSMRQLATIPDDTLLESLAALLRTSRQGGRPRRSHWRGRGPRLYAREASPSMWSYCTDRLHLSGAEAWLRIAAGRPAPRASTRSFWRCSPTGGCT